MLQKMKGLLRLASVSTSHRHIEQTLGHSYDDQNIMHTTYKYWKRVLWNFNMINSTNTIRVFFETSLQLTPTN